MGRAHYTKASDNGRVRISANVIAILCVVCCAFPLLSCSRKNTFRRPGAVLASPTNETASTLLDTREAAVTPLYAVTSTPEPAGTPTVTVVSPQAPVWVVAALVYPDVDKIILIGPTAEQTREVSVPETPIDVAWSPQGCGLRVTVTTGHDIRLLEINLGSNAMRELFVSDGKTGSGLKTAPRLSPDGQWVAYVVWSGYDKSYVGAEFQDVQVVAVDKQAEPFRLTKRGGSGVFGGVWSPDGRYLAYSDYDQDGNGQLYYAHPDGSDLHQMTHFNMSKVTVETIRWSPDGRSLAFSVYGPEGAARGVWIVRSDGSNLRELILDDGSVLDGTPLWWSADGRSLVVFVGGSDAVEGLYWFDVSENRAYHTLHSSESPDPNAGIVSPFAIFDVQTIGFSGGAYELYSYDLGNRSIKLWLDTTKLFPGFDFDSEGGTLLGQISSVPGGPVDISQCPR